MISIIDDDIFNTDASAILHQANCKGIMGSGIAKQVKEKYPSVFLKYKAECASVKDSSLLLGKCQIVKVNRSQYICNLFSQNDFGYSGKCYTNYEAFAQSLELVNEKFKGKKVAVPYLIACDRGGGNWERVLRIIKDKLSDCEVVLYRLK